ncbi:hypothetical protein [Alicyclobacillus ferrooxydans]|uniref:hypothetical protein n=1 Tax=Alicyclobacillus ferrooxydans TaxID=471514 RepID=UPI0006D5681C|nr:hypothetical protein [Alicyclobacillus ferrooxydans]
MGYFEAVGAELKKSWWNAVVVVVFTIARLIFGWDWFKAGLEKLSWLSNGKANSAGMIQGMVKNLQHSHGADPLHLNNLLVWFANHLFLTMTGLTDFLVVAFEILIGVFVFFGFGFIYTMVAALFLNLQYATAGSANNFGYLVTDIVWFKFPSYASLIGIDGYIRHRRGQNLLGPAGKATRKLSEGRDEGGRTSLPTGGRGGARA